MPVSSNHLHYQIFGEGPVVVWLHGFCLDSTIWFSLIKKFTNFRSVVIDLPGFGLSQATAFSDIKSLSQIIQDCLYSLSIKDFILIGHSLGAYIGLEMLGSNQLNIRGFGLIHSHPFSDDQHKLEERKKSMRIVRKGKKTLFLKHLIHQLFSDEFIKENPSMVDQYLDKAKTYDSQIINDYMLAMSNKLDHKNTLERISCPVLCVGGGLDPLISSGQFLGQCLLPCTVFIHLLERCSHMSMLEDPDRLRYLFSEYLSYCLNFIR